MGISVKTVCVTIGSQKHSRIVASGEIVIDTAREPLAGRFTSPGRRGDLQTSEPDGCCALIPVMIVREYIIRLRRRKA